MKKLGCIALSVLLFFSAGLFVSCGTSTDDGTDEEFTNITLEDKTFTYDGEPHSLAIQGTLPDGTEVTYQNNGKTDAGEYTVTATLSKAGYKTLGLSAVLTIEKAQQESYPESRKTTFSLMYASILMYPSTFSDISSAAGSGDSMFSSGYNLPL